MSTSAPRSATRRASGTAGRAADVAVGRAPAAAARPAPRPAGPPRCAPRPPTPAGRARRAARSPRRRRVPGSRIPGRPATDRRERRVGAEQLVDRDRVGVQVEQPAQPGHRRAEVARVGQPQRGHARAPAAGASAPSPARAAAAASARTSPSTTDSTPATRAGARGSQQPGRVERRRNGSRSTSVPAAAGVAAAPPGLGAQRARRHPVHRADGVVELADAGEPGRERDVGHGAAACVSTSSRAVCARCALASASGPAPSSAVSTRLRCRSE